MRDEVLRLIKKNGPVTVESLMRFTGMENKPVRSAIDQLRLSGEPVCHSKRGFWFNPGFVPNAVPHLRWKCEPNE